MTHVWDHSPLEGGALLILLALADRADDDGFCWPSVSYLAAKARLSERQVKRILKELVANGEIDMPAGPRSEERPFRIVMAGVTPMTPGQNVTVTPASPGGGHGRHPGGDTTGAREDPSVDTSVETPTRLPTTAQREAAAVKRCWDYYLSVIPSKRALDDKRKRILKSALKVVGEERVMLAILGLSRSPWHNGSNEGEKKYLELHYALKGIGNESDDARIEKAIGWAREFSPTNGNGNGKLSAATRDRLLEEVRYTMSLPTRPELQRGIAAYDRLTKAGYKVTKLARAPYARIEP
jgi:hypothetical protein